MNTIWSKTLHVLEIGIIRSDLNDEQLTLLSMWLACYLTGNKPNPLLFNDSCDLIIVEIKEINGVEKCVFTSKQSVLLNVLVGLSPTEVSELLTEINMHGKNQHPPIKTVDPKGNGIVVPGVLSITQEGLWVMSVPEHREIAWPIAMIPSKHTQAYYGGVGTPSKGFQDPSWVYEFKNVIQAI
jgi:hypothetical protein